MKAELLIAIRRSRIRLIPIIEQQQVKFPKKEILFQWLRVIKPLGSIPIRVAPTYRLFLDGKTSINSKSRAVIDEIPKDLYQEQLTWYPKLDATSPLLLFTLRTLFRLPWILFLFISQFKKLSSLDKVGLQVFVGYAAYLRFFLKHEKLSPIIISDISPTLYMQWSAAVAIGRGVFWWQDDFHHYKGFSSEDYMPYRATIAAVLNQKGVETVKAKSPNAEVFCRPQMKVKPLKKLPMALNVGIATNAFFEASNKQLDIIKKTIDSLGTAKAYLRLHPNSKLDRDHFSEDWITVAPMGETLDSYAEKVDIAVIGNSAVQLKLLCMGVPVLHLAGLDAYGYDVYGYCKKGFCFGVSDTEINETLTDNLRKFYGSESLQEKLISHVQVREELPELSQFVYHAGYNSLK